MELVWARIGAIAIKEWRLNCRFAVEYFAANLISPIKSAILMYFLYRGLLQGYESLGRLDKNNFSLFVFLGTACHSLFMSSVYVFRSKMTTEKFWQTVTATLISPASTLEVIAGFILGSGTLNFAIAVSIFGFIAWFHPISLSAFLTALLVLFLLALFGFGMGILGATISLCFEGKCFLFDYGVQALIFLSCFYYPIETLPSTSHALVRLLPTYHASQLIQDLFLFGHTPHFILSLAYVGVASIVSIVFPAFFFNYAVKKYGIVGY